MELDEDLAGFFETTLCNQPTGRLGAEPNETELVGRGSNLDQSREPP